MEQGEKSMTLKESEGNDGNGMSWVDGGGGAGGLPSPSSTRVHSFSTFDELLHSSLMQSRSDHVNSGTWIFSSKCADARASVYVGN